MHIQELFPKEKLDEMVEAKYVNVGEHESGDYLIYNYGQLAQFDQVWNDVTIQCRGLITDTDGNILARPFRKFFALEQHAHDARLKRPYTVQEKADGSLGILWFDHSGRANIATRGSFHSDQAKWATYWWHGRGYLPETIDDFFPVYANPETRRSNVTCLFEIIYSENRIVIDYKGKEGLVYLGSIDIATGIDTHVPLETDRILSHDIRAADPNRLKEKALNNGLVIDDGNTEGFVLVFDMGKDQPSFRVKVKLDEYVRLHRILTNTSNKTVWTHLMEGLPLDDLLESVPDEFYDWLMATVAGLQGEYRYIEEMAEVLYKDIWHLERKDFALKVQDSLCKDIMFKMLDNRDYSENIWKRLKPVYSKPFANKENEE